MSSRQERQYPRYALEASIELAFDGATVTGRTQNLSRGGLCAEIAEALVPGTDLEARISLVFDIEAASEPLVVFARIVWCTPLSEGYQVGLKFGALDSEQRSNLELFLRFLEEGRKRGAL